jgi:SAM-dependent methyltransferase
MYYNLKKELFNCLYKDVDGYDLSYQSGQRQNLNGNNFVYGEINFDTFADLLDELPYNSEQRVFYDLGSGVGKPVIAAALLGDFQKLVGIEMLEDLHLESMRVKNLFNSDVRKLFPSKAAVQIDFICGNLLTTDFSDGDLVFVQSTCFNEELMEKLEQKCNELKPGSLVITGTKSLPTWQVTGMKKYKMSWGEACLFFHVKQP